MIAIVSTPPPLLCERESWLNIKARLTFATTTTDLQTNGKLEGHTLLCVCVCVLKAALGTGVGHIFWEINFQKEWYFDKVILSLLSDDFSQLDEFNSPPSNFIPQIHFYPHSLSGSICATFYVHSRFRCKPHHQNCNTDLVRTKVILHHSPKI